MELGGRRVESELGRGGAGVVYRALEPDGRVVAIKLLGARSERALARFQREIELQRQLGRKAGFVPILDAGMDPRGAYLVMPFLPGGTLRDRLRRAPNGLPAVDLLELGTSLATSLGHAHEAGLVHRDLKPENVLFDELDCALIADLGLAKASQEGRPADASGLSRTGELRGTLGYMAPEQLADAKRAGPAADVFALGAILYECAAGHPAFAGQGTLAVLEATRAGRYPPLERRDLAPAFKALIARCLAVDPAQRPASGRALAEELSRVPLEARGRSPALALACLLGSGALLALGWTSRAGPEPSATTGRAATVSPTRALGPATPTPASAPSAAPTPSPAPATTPAATPAASAPPAAWSRRSLAGDVAAVGCLEVVEQLGTGLHRSAHPLAATCKGPSGTIFALDRNATLRAYQGEGFGDVGHIQLSEPWSDELSIRSSPDGLWVATALRGGKQVHVYDVRAKRDPMSLTLELPLAALDFAAPGPIVALSQGNTVHLVDVLSQKPLPRPLLHPGLVRQLAGAEGSLFVGLEDGAVHVWSLRAGEPPQGPTRVADVEGLSALAASARGELLAAMNATEIVVFRRGSEGPVARLALEEAPVRLSFLAGERLAVHWRTRVAILDVRRRVMDGTVRFGEPLLCSELTPDGAWVAFAMRISPHHLRFLRVGEKEPIRSPYGLVDPVLCVAPAPGGVVAGGRWGSASRWRGGALVWGTRVRGSPALGVEWLEGSVPVTGLAGGRLHRAEDGEPFAEDPGLTSLARGAGQLWAGTREGGVLRLSERGQTIRQGLHRHVLAGRPVPVGFVLPLARDRLLSGSGAGLQFSAGGGPARALSREVLADIAPVGPEAFAVAYASGRLALHRLEDGERLVEVQAGAETCYAVGASPSGRTLITSDEAGGRVWSWKEGKLQEQRRFALGNSRDLLTCVAPGATPDEVLLGSARGVIVRARWRPD